MYTKTSPASALGPVAWCSDGKRWEDMTGLFIKNLEKWRKMTENDGGVVFLWHATFFGWLQVSRPWTWIKLKFWDAIGFWWLKHDCKGFYRVIGGPPMALWCQLAAVDSPSHITIQRPQRTHVWCSPAEKEFLLYRKCHLDIKPLFLGWHSCFFS